LQVGAEGVPCGSNGKLSGGVLGRHSCTRACFGWYPKLLGRRKQGLASLPDRRVRSSKTVLLIQSTSSVVLGWRYSGLTRLLREKKPPVAAIGGGQQWCAFGTQMSTTVTFCGTPINKGGRTWNTVRPPLGRTRKEVLAENHLRAFAGVLQCRFEHECSCKRTRLNGRNLTQSAFLRTLALRAGRKLALIFWNH
jgi:hypothetical protein